MKLKPLAFMSMLGVILPSIASADQAQRLTILHTNDHHGRFWQDSKGQLGMAARKTLIDEIRTEVAEQGGELLLLSAGDVNTGVPESDLQFAKPDFLGMDLLGYDAMAVGNHEFDVPAGVREMQQIWSQVPFLSANIRYKDSQETPYAPYMVFNLSGLSVAVVGLTTTDTPKVGSKSLAEVYDFVDPIQVSRDVLPELAEADVRIALSHMGHYPNGTHGTSAPGDVTLARELAYNSYDIIVGGHSQREVCYDADGNYIQRYQPMMTCYPDRVNGTWIVQAQEWGRYVGRVDLLVTEESVELLDYRLIPVNLKYQKDDVSAFYDRKLMWNEDVYRELEPYFAQGNQLINFKVGQLGTKLIGDRAQIRSQQTNLGSAITDSMMNKLEADVAVMSSGGMRDSIDLGDVTYRDVLQVLPFGNSLVRVTLTGRELNEYLTAVKSMSPGTGAFAQYSSNISWQNETPLVNGQPIDATRHYTLALNGFNARGGDNYPAMNDHSSFVDSGFLDADALKEWVENQ